MLEWKNVILVAFIVRKLKYKFGCQISAPTCGQYHDIYITIDLRNHVHVLRTWYCDHMWRVLEKYLCPWAVASAKDTSPKPTAGDHSIMFSTPNMIAFLTLHIVCEYLLNLLLNGRKTVQSRPWWKGKCYLVTMVMTALVKIHTPYFSLTSFQLLILLMKIIVKSITPSWQVLTRPWPL